jgi:hypothetical protein
MGKYQESKLKDQNETESPNLSLNGFSNFDFRSLLFDLASLYRYLPMVSKPLPKQEYPDPRAQHVQQ